MTDQQVEQELKEILKLAAENWLQASSVEKIRRIGIAKTAGWLGKVWTEAKRLPDTLKNINDASENANNVFGTANSYANIAKKPLNYMSKAKGYLPLIATLLGGASMGSIAGGRNHRLLGAAGGLATAGAGYYGYNNRAAILKQLKSYF